MKQYWFNVSQAKAREMAAQGFKIKQKKNLQWKVLCAHAQLCGSRLAAQDRNQRTADAFNASGMFPLKCIGG